MKHQDEINLKSNLPLFSYGYEKTKVDSLIKYISAPNYDYYLMWNS